MKNLVDEFVLEPHGARVPVLSVSHASSSHEASLEPPRRVDTGNHSIKTERPKLRDLSDDLNYKSSLQNTCCWSRTSRRKL